MRNTFAQHLLDLAIEDERILLITGDLGFGVLDKFMSELPNQFINGGVAEQSIMSMAAGLASQGYRPFVYSIANFPTFRCLEQIRNDVSYMNNPVTIVSVGAGLSYGIHGYTHHAVEDLTIMRAFTNIDIYSPSDPVETKFSLASIVSRESPAYLRLGKGGEGDINFEPMDKIQDYNLIGGIKGHGVICWTGSIGIRVIKAAEILKLSGLRPLLVSVPKLSNSSLKGVLNLANNGFLLTVEEHILSGGFGSMMLEVAATNDFGGKIARLGVSDTYHSELGSQDYLLDLNGLSPIQIAAYFIEQKLHNI